MANESIDLEFVLHHTVSVKFHKYRTARVSGFFFQCNRRASDATALEEELAKRAGVHTDNHVVYEIENTFKIKIYVWCTDSNMYFGSELIEGSW